MMCLLADKDIRNHKEIDMELSILKLYKHVEEFHYGMEAMMTWAEICHEAQFVHALNYL